MNLVESDAPRVEIRVFLPNHMMHELKRHADTRGVLPGHLIGFLVDHALLNPKLFDYPTEPKQELIEHGYIEEAQKLVEYLEDAGTPLSPHTLIMGRMDWGVPDRETAKCALRELLVSGIAEVVDWHPKYRMEPKFKAVKLKKMDYKAIARRKKKTLFTKLLKEMEENEQK